MKAILKFSILSIAWTIFTYAMAAFLFGSLDSMQWTFAGRFVYITFGPLLGAGMGIWLCYLILYISYKPKK